MVKLERGKVHSNGNKETCVLFSRLQTERGVGEQNLSLPSQEEETWPRRGTNSDGWRWTHTQ
jgi:hypothetical protein